MSNILNLTLLETKFNLKTKEFNIGVLLCLFYTIVIFFFSDFKNVNINTFYEIFADVSYYVIIVISALIASKDFTLKTSRIVYTQGILRKNILISKVLSVIIIGLIIGVISRSSNLILYYFVKGKFDLSIVIELYYKTIICYGVFSFLIVSFGILISVLSFNRIFTLVFTIIFLKVHNIIMFFLDHFSQKYFFTKSPFYIINLILIKLQYEVIDIVIVIIISFILVLISCKILINKDIQ